jgi:AbrB family looped-hinge helix DNA binding protein
VNDHVNILSLGLSVELLICFVAMIMEMVIKIDKQGRLVLPKEIREKYQLSQDAELVVTEIEGGIKLSPRRGKKSLKGIFDAAPAFNPKNAIVIDVANYDENHDEEHD